MKQWRQINLKTFTNRGYALTPVEFKDVVPFAPKRLYYITQFSSDAETGQHCHKVEEEVFFLVAGVATAVIDRGAGLEEIHLQAPSDAFYAPNLSWHGFKNMSADAVILAVSSTNYSPDRSDYVEDYQEFLRLRAEQAGQR
jgi:mannose-6-phosphate isomerase-like protein (cupin superfamily)